MSWTRGQSSRTNQSPFIDPTKEDNHQNAPSSSAYTQHHHRKDYNPRIYQTSPRGQDRDVAATFTQEGLQTFSTIFSSAVEAAISKTLPEVVERAVERKMKDVMNEVLSDSQQVISGLISHMVQTQLPMENRSHCANSTEPAGPEDAVTEYVQAESSPHSEIPTDVVGKQYRAQRRLDAELQNLIQFLKRMDRSVKMEEVRSSVDGIEWGRNASIKMSTLMRKSGGQIERVSKGMYRFNEPN